MVLSPAEWDRRKTECSSLASFSPDHLSLLPWFAYTKQVINTLVSFYHQSLILKISLWTQHIFQKNSSKMLCLFIKKVYLRFSQMLMNLTFFFVYRKDPPLTHVAFVFSCSGLGSLHLHANETRNGFIPFPFWSDLKLCDFPLVCHFTPCVFLISVSSNNLLKFSNRGGFSSGVNRMTENKQWNCYRDVVGRKTHL